MRAAVTALLLAGCVTTSGVRPQGPELVLRLAPASFGGELSTAQRITMVRDGDRKGFDALLEIDADAVRVALLGAGQTLGTLTWDGRDFTKKVSVFVPEVVTAERIITDVELCFWPEAPLRAALPAGYTLEESDGARHVLRDGEPFVTVTWSEGRKRVVLTQHVYRYTLEIDSTDPLSRGARVEVRAAVG